MIALGRRVDRSGEEGLVLVGRHRLQNRATGAAEFPIAGGELRLGAQPGDVAGALCVAIGALAVDRHRRGHDHATQLRAPLDRRLQHDGGAEAIGRYIVFDLVHRLAHADRGGLVEHGVHAVQGRAYGIPVAHVPHTEFGGGVKGGRPRRALPVDLGVQVVEHPHAVAVFDQAVDEMGSDESGAARHQDSHWEPPLVSRVSPAAGSEPEPPPSVSARRRTPESPQSAGRPARCQRSSPIRPERRSRWEDDTSASGADKRAPRVSFSRRTPRTARSAAGPWFFRKNR